MSSVFLPFLAGLLTTFSPCVLPVIPLVVGGSLRTSKWGPLFLLSGLVVSFSLIGTFATSLLFSLGFSPSILSDIGAILIVLVGLFLFFSSLDNLFKSMSGNFSAKVDSTLNRLAPSGTSGQFVIGLLIGLVWLPCTGPTLGAAIGLAAQGKDLGSVFLTMFSFALGAVVPLSLYAFSAKHFSSKMETFSLASTWVKKSLALLFIFIGVSIYFGWHKELEAVILEFLPAWWVNGITLI